MKIFHSNLVALMLGIVVITGISSCKGKPTDAEIQSSVAGKVSSGVSATVSDGAVTLSGECKDEECRKNCEKATSDVTGVKKVTNNIQIASAPVSHVEISADDPLRNSVTGVIGTYKGVEADVKDGVVTLRGEIKRSDLQNLMMKLNELKPRKIENQLVIK